MAVVCVCRCGVPGNASCPSRGLKTRSSRSRTASSLHLPPPLWGRICEQHAALRQTHSEECLYCDECVCLIKKKNCHKDWARIMAKSMWTCNRSTHTWSVLFQNISAAVKAATLFSGFKILIPTDSVIDAFVIFGSDVPLSYLQLVRLIHSHLKEKRDRKKDRHLLCCKVLQMSHYVHLSFPNDEDKWENKNWRASGNKLQTHNCQDAQR